MNRSFENIFEKYNITCVIPKKRRRSTNSLSGGFNRKSLPLAAKVGAANSISNSISNVTITSFSSSYCYNNRSKAKYSIPTRYKRLELTEEHEKENRREIPSVIKENALNDNSPEADVSVGNDNYNKPNNTAHSLLKNNCGTSFGINETNLLVTKCSFSTSNSENNEGATTQCTQNGSSELDLLIELIERDAQNDLKKRLIDKQNEKKNLQCDERLLVTKPCLKGGLQEMFERSLKNAKAKSNFLKYDKNFGLRIGQPLLVLKIDTFQGLTLATVRNQDLNKDFAVAVTREMGLHLKLGSQIEAFFDNTTLPYKLLLNGDYCEVYLEPYKIISE